MTIAFENKIESENYVNTNILGCIKFWNNQGHNVYQKNLDHYYGNEKTWKEAETTPYGIWVLNQLAIDCNTFCKSDTAKETGIKFESGRSGSHVWLHENDERTLMMYAQ